MDFIKWIAKNRRFSRWIMLGVILLFVYLLKLLGVPVWVLVTLYIGLMLLSFVIIETYPPLIVQSKAVETYFNDCDPFPLLKLSRELLSSKISPSAKFPVTLNYCVALRGIGEYQKAFDCLMELNIDALPEGANGVKFICYNNLGDTCMMLENFPEASSYYHKALEIFPLILNEQEKDHLMQIHNGIQADLCYINKDYKRSSEFLEAIESNQKESLVSYALANAKNYIKLGNFEKATEKLEFVIANGNKLFAVVEAKKLMDLIKNEAAHLDN